MYTYVSFHPPFVMPSGEWHGACAKRLICAFVKLNTWRPNRALHRECIVVVVSFAMIQSCLASMYGDKLALDY